MAYDFNGAKEQIEVGGVIPDGTVATVQVTVRPGGAGDGGWLKRASTGSAGLDLEFTVVDGPYAKRKFWKLLTLEGPEDGHAKAAEISGSQIRGILESARGIRPDDESEAARNARKINDWGDLDGLRFIAKICVENGGINKVTGEKYKDKNTLAIAITPDRKQWTKVEQIKATAPTVATAAAAASVAKAPAAGRPSWAS